MKSVNLILHGLKVPKNVMFKYNNLYTQKTIHQSLDYSCIIKGNEYKSYHILNDKIKTYENIHIHSFSGSAHYLINFLELYPENKDKIKSQIYDSPSHVDGAINYFKKYYNIPPYATNYLINSLFKNCKKTSNIFMEKPIIKNIPTGLIISSNDIISPRKPINKMIKNWNRDCKIEILKTDSKHIQSFKDYPEKYINFCRNIQSAEIK